MDLRDNLNRKKLLKLQYTDSRKKQNIPSSQNKNPNRVIGGMRSAGTYSTTVYINGEPHELATSKYVEYLEEQNRNLRERCNTLENRVKRLERRLSTTEGQLNKSINQTNNNLRRLNEEIDKNEFGE